MICTAGKRHPATAASVPSTATAANSGSMPTRTAMARASDGGTRTAADVLRAHWGGTEAAATQEMLKRLRDALERGRMIETVGDRAVMRYGVGLQHAAQLVREEGPWRVEDPA